MGSLCSCGPLGVLELGMVILALDGYLLFGRLDPDPGEPSS